MTASTEPARLIPLAGVREILATTLTGPGRAYLESCGYVTLAHFERAITDLPDPCPEPEVIGAILAVFGEHGGSWLIPELAGLWEARWPGPVAAVVPEDAPAASGMPKCGYCGQPCKHKSARYCTPSHRQQAYKRRKQSK